MLGFALTDGQELGPHLTLLWTLSRPTPPPRRGQQCGLSLAAAPPCRLCTFSKPARGLVLRHVQ